MANPPNIVSVAKIFGMTETTNLTGTSPTAATPIMANPADNYTHKVNMIIVSNIDGTNNCDIDIYIDENTILDTKIEMTIVGGKIVYSRN